MTKSEKWLMIFTVIYDALKYVIDHFKQWTSRKSTTK